MQEPQENTNFSLKHIDYPEGLRYEGVFDRVLKRISGPYTSYMDNFLHFINFSFHPSQKELGLAVGYYAGCWLGFLHQFKTDE